MSDKEKRYAVLDKFYAQHYGSMEAASVVDSAVIDAMADRIVELEAAAERVRALHVGEQAFYPNWDGAVICPTCNRLFPCPTLRALEGTP